MPLPGAQPTIIQGDLVVAGNFSCQTQTLPDASVQDVNVVSGTPGNFIDPSKLRSRVSRFYSQPNTTATSVTQAIHYTVGATGQVLTFQAGSIAKCVGAATITIDLKKNGTTILNAVITLDSSSTNRAAVNASFSSTVLAVGDELEIVVVATAGGGTIGTGLFVNLILNEDPF